MILLGIGVICCIGGILAIAADWAGALFILLGALGLVLLVLGISEPRVGCAKLLTTGAFVLYCMAFFAYAAMNYFTGRFVTAAVFSAAGILTLISAGYLAARKEAECT